MEHVFGQPACCNPDTPFCFAAKRVPHWIKTLLMIGCFIAVSFGPVMTDPAIAQDPPAADAADAADNAAAPDDADGNGEQQSDDSNAPPEEKTLLRWLYVALGWQYLGIFTALSFTLVALTCMNLISAQRKSVCPPELIEEFEQHLDNKEYQVAYELSKSDESFLGNVLAAGLARLSRSYSHAVSAMEEVGAEENMKLEHRLSYLALIGTLSPMIGLFGTVHGMINSFYEIAAGGGTPDANKLANGISTALLTTLFGLAVAIPAIAAYNLLRNRVQRLSLEVGIESENLMSRFEKVGNSKRTTGDDSVEAPPKTSK